MRLQDDLASRNINRSLRLYDELDKYNQSSLQKVLFNQRCPTK